ncbi:MAG: hypothetical protein OXF06_10135 [Bacteroidetes bacterium]|nr:hypothetical protein [Bacteroidota bacterium]MCY4225182.1 hypothetical protein [Bacteroidota bacterium]
MFGEKQCLSEGQILPELNQVQASVIKIGGLMRNICFLLSRERKPFNYSRLLDKNSPTDGPLKGGNAPVTAPSQIQKSLKILPK